MTDAEKQRFRDVIISLIQNGTYGQLVSHHANMMHKTANQTSEILASRR
jgi:hypothetical protein